MPLSSAELQAVQRASKAARNQAASERRATGFGYRKVRVAVQTIETTAPDGTPLVLATSDAPAEAGRYFRVTSEAGRWRCACGAFKSLGGCHHVGWLAQQTGQTGQTGQAGQGV